MRFQERLKWNIYTIKLKDNRIINLRHDNNDVLLIKSKGGKNINDLLDKIKNKGEIVNKPEYKDKKKTSKQGIDGEDEGENGAYTKVQYFKAGGDEAYRPRFKHWTRTLN